MSALIEQNKKKDIEDSSSSEFSMRRKAYKAVNIIADTVYARLRDAILSAELRPNKRLIEDDLADWLNVSRTPIREALLRLEHEGLVERNRGWLVREHNPTEIRARLESRIAIESYAAHLAAGRRTETDILKLRSVVEDMGNANISRQEFNELNYHFHIIITESANNSTMMNLYNQTKLNYWDLSVPIIFSHDIERTFQEQHNALIDALEAGDGNMAESITRMHIQLTTDIVLDMLK